MHSAWRGWGAWCNACCLGCGCHEGVGGAALQWQCIYLQNLLKMCYCRNFKKQLFSEGVSRGWEYFVCELSGLESGAATARTAWVRAGHDRGQAGHQGGAACERQAVCGQPVIRGVLHVSGLLRRWLLPPGRSAGARPGARRGGRGLLAVGSVGGAGGRLLYPGALWGRRADGEEAICAGAL